MLTSTNPVMLQLVHAAKECKHEPSAAIGPNTTGPAAGMPEAQGQGVNPGAATASCWRCFELPLDELVAWATARLCLHHSLMCRLQLSSKASKGGVQPGLEH